MNSALCLGYCLEEIINQDSFINSSSLCRLGHFSIKYLDGHKLTISLLCFVFFLINVFADETHISMSILHFTVSP